MNVEKHFGSSGDFGDVIYLLPLLQSFEKTRLSLYDRPWTKKISSRYHVFEPLLSAQPYIQEVTLTEESAPLDLSTFRPDYKPTQSLLASQCAHGKKKYGLPIVKGDTPWLFVNKAKETKGRVVIARSPRYHNDLFPWKTVLNHYGQSVLFVGLPEEHEDFSKKFGRVEHRPVKDLLELAELIAGSELFVGNQSSPYAIAEGLKHPRILECNLRVPDCIFPNGGQICYDGRLDYLPAVGKRKRVEFTKDIKFRKDDWMCCPPGQWQYPGYKTQNDINALAQIVAREVGCKVPEARQAVYQFNCERLPDYFKDNVGAIYDRVLKAIQAAK
jgi:hypothetical protein